MILCGGDQVLFGLYSFAIICLLIGGCIWGQGQDDPNKDKLIGGIVVFIIGGGFFALAIFTNIVKKTRSLQSKRKNAKVMSENTKPFVNENEQFQINNVKKLDNLVTQNGSNLQINDSKTHLNNISADNFKVVPSPYPNQSPIHFTNNRQIVDNTPTILCYSNPVFESEKVYPQHILPFTLTQKPNAAKNYSRSLYNAHLAGKL